MCSTFVLKKELCVVLVKYYILRRTETSVVLN